MALGYEQTDKAVNRPCRHRLTVAESVGIKIEYKSPCHDNTGIYYHLDYLSLVSGSHLSCRQAAPVP